MSNAKKKSAGRGASATPTSPVTTVPESGPAVDPYGVYPERRTRTVPPPAELARVPASGAFCSSQLCLEMKYNLPFYLRKSDLMRFLRTQHDYWWGRYTQLYEKNAYTYPTNRNSSGWDYTNAAKEMLSRCKLYDSLYVQSMKIDLTHVNDFGTYCKLNFIEIGKLKPAFPDTPSSQAVFEGGVREVMKFILKQAPADFDAQSIDYSTVRSASASVATADADADDLD